MFSRIFGELFSNNNKETEPKDFEWEKWQKTAKEQFLKLRKMGIRFPVISL